MKRWIFNSFIWYQATEDFKKTHPAFVKKREEPLSSRLERGSLLCWFCSLHSDKICDMTLRYRR